MSDKCKDLGENKIPDLNAYGPDTMVEPSLGQAYKSPEEMVFAILGTAPISFDEAAKKLSGSLFLTPEGPMPAPQLLYKLAMEGKLILDFTNKIIRPPTPEEKVKMEPLFAEVIVEREKLKKLREQIKSISMPGEPQE
ncbi:MAG: hypothetical protein WC471_02965 [Candidatus Woesearchaeota archaeon]